MTMQIARITKDDVETLSSTEGLTDTEDWVTAKFEPAHRILPFPERSDYSSSEECHAAQREWEETEFPKMDENDESVVFDLEKNWGATNYLFSKPVISKNTPERFLVLGTPVGPDFTGFGPACYLTVAQTEQVAIALGKVTETDLRSRYDPADMDRREIYPGEWVREGSKPMEQLVDTALELMEFVREAARTKHGLIILMT